MEQNTDKYKSENGKLLSTFLRLQDGTVINMSHISAISPISEHILPGENGVVYGRIYFTIQVNYKAYNYTKQMTKLLDGEGFNEETGVFEQERQVIIESWKEAVLASQ